MGGGLSRADLLSRFPREIMVSKLRPAIAARRRIHRAGGKNLSEVTAVGSSRAPPRPGSRPSAAVIGAHRFAPFLWRFCLGGPALRAQTKKFVWTWSPKRPRGGLGGGADMCYFTLKV